MRSISFIFLLLCFNVYSQPINDDCNGIINLGSVPNCSVNNNYSNTSATPSDIGFDDTPASCIPEGATSFEHDVWFQFSTIGDIIDVSIILKGINGGNSITNPQIAIYRGVCGTDGLAWINCVAADSASNSVQLNVQGLTPNTTFFVRISDLSYDGSDNSGDFNLCIQSFTPTFTIADGFSNSCVGMLSDDGGPDGNYSDNQNSTFTICPQDFHTCINFNLSYFNIESSEFGVQDNILIYDGNDTNGPLLADIAGSNFQGGGGGVCVTVIAFSGCLTVQMITNETQNFEGFEANWKCGVDACAPVESLNVADTIDLSAIEQLLSTPASIVKVISLQCPQGALGSFINGDETDLGIGKGIVLSSGLATNAEGPNNVDDISTDFLAPGDADLDSLSNIFGDSVVSQDACILELEITANTNEIQFEYVFGSEEYLQFVDGGFNDIFAFLVSGDGIVGIPQLNGKKNIAVIPETGDPIQINSVHNLENWEYYRPNDILGTGQSIQYNGLTSDRLGLKKSLTAKTTTTPCETYRLKLAIADRGDGIYDSGVFISEIRGGTPNMDIVFASGLNYFIEDCSGTEDVLRILLSEPLDSAFTINISISGTAILGTDYTLEIPNSITFNAGEIEKLFPIIPLTDNLIEEPETIIIEFSADFGCGEITFKTIEAIIRDEAEINIQLEGDTLLTCANNTISLSIEGALEYEWSPPSIFNDPFSSSPEVSPMESGYIYVTGTVANCTDTDSIYILVVNPSFGISQESPLEVCVHDFLQLNAQSDFDISDISWTPAFFFDNTKVVNPIFNTDFAFNASITATAIIANCTFTDEIDVVVDAIDVATIRFRDSIICEGTSLLLAEPLFFTNSTYDWEPNINLDDNTIPNAIATPTASTAYILTTTGPSGNCIKKDTVNIMVNPIQAVILGADTIFICKGDSVDLSAIAGPSTDSSFEWSPTFGLSDPTSLTPVVFTDNSVKYYFTVSTAQCSRIDSVLIKVDSLPKNLEILNVTPPRPVYCPEEIISIFSPAYTIQNFPDITHLWGPNNGTFQSDVSELNVAIEARDTTEYFRITTNNACRDTHSIVINVISPTVQLSVMDTTLCAGSTFVLSILDTTITDIVWSPEDLVSCSSCPSPIVTVNGIPGSSIVIGVVGKKSQCVVKAFMDINILPNEELNIGPISYCSSKLDTVIDLSNLGFTNYSWQVESGDINLSCIDCPNPTITPNSGGSILVTADSGAGDRCALEGIILFEEKSIGSFQTTNFYLCPGEVINIDIFSGSNVTEIDWVKISGDALIDCINCVNPEFTGGMEESIFNFSGSSADSCFSGNVIINLLQLQIPQIICPRDSLIIGSPGLVTASPVPQNATEIIWTINGEVLDNQNSIDLEFVPNGFEINFELNITTANNCTVMSSGSCPVMDDQPSFPNAFTPYNNDGMNDTFRPISLGNFMIDNLKVFNRWGQLVYDGSDADGWDGLWKGKEVSADVYIYKFTLRRSDGMMRVFGGDVTLIR